MPLAAGFSALLLCIVSWTSAAESESLEQRHAEFLEQTHYLLQPAEREVWDELTENYQRDAFIRRFWRERDQTPETARNEFREAFEQNLVAAKERYDDLTVERARFMLAHGRPTRTFQTSCEVLRRLDIWYYRSSTLFAAEFYAVFLREAGDYRLWSQNEGLFPLAQFTSALDDRDTALEIERQCARSTDILQALALSPNWNDLDERLFPESSTEWARAFLASSTTLPSDASPLRASVSLDYTGRRQSRTVVDALIEVESADVAVDTVEERKIARFLVDGEVLREEELFESFRYRFDLPLANDVRRIPITVQRYLRPGSYQLNLRVQDLVADTYYREELDVTVPRLEIVRDSGPADAAPVTHTGQDDLAEDLDEDDEARRSVRLFVPQDELMVGTVRVEAQARGEGIARVSFSLDGRQLMSKRTPPYSLEIDVGRTPRTHTLRAAALDDEGLEVASDEVLINGGPHRFSVRLTSPTSGQSTESSVQAVAQVEVPRLEELDRVEFYLNEDLIAALYQEPFVQRIEVPQDEALSYVRAVGHLQSGGAAEDIVFVNAPDLVDRFDVNLVELYTTITDRRGRPVDDVTSDDIQVLENGKPQAIVRFEPAKNLPIHACVLLDTSTSMEDRLREAEEAALYFLELVMTERDRACLMVFNDEPNLVVPFTNSTGILAGGLSGLVAEGETALHDSLIQSLFRFGGVRGKRALILLSDGADSNSEYTFEEVLEYARRSGVTIYSIGLSIDSRALDVRSKLNRLCRETGGTCFFIEGAPELKRIYERIEREVRTQYVISYQSSAGENRDFRQIEIKARQGLKAKTIRGYYP